MLGRKSSIVLFSALLITATGMLVMPNQFLLPRVAGVNRSIVLVGFISAWNFSGTTPNPTITVSQGDSVSLQLSSGDGSLHRWFVDVDGNGPTPDCPGADVCSNAFSTSTTLTFTVTFAPGTYTYYCSVHPATMLGKFVVNPSSSVGGSTLPPNRGVLLAPYLELFSALAIAITTAAAIYFTRQRRK